MSSRDPSAILVPSAEWQDLDITDEQKAEWMAQVEPPPTPPTEAAHFGSRDGSDV